MADPKHHPTLYRTGRFGCWATCICGWQTERRYTGVIGAHLAFAGHLSRPATTTGREADDA